MCKLTTLPNACPTKITRSAPVQISNSNSTQPNYHQLALSLVCHKHSLTASGSHLVRSLTESTCSIRRSRSSHISNQVFPLLLPLQSTIKPSIDRQKKLLNYFNRIFKFRFCNAQLSVKSTQFVVTLSPLSQLVRNGECCWGKEVDHVVFGEAARFLVGEGDSHGGEWEETASVDKYH